MVLPKYTVSLPQDTARLLGDRASISQTLNEATAIVMVAGAGSAAASELAEKLTTINIMLGDMAVRVRDAMKDKPEGYVNMAFSPDGKSVDIETVEPLRGQALEAENARRHRNPNPVVTVRSTVSPDRIGPPHVRITDSTPDSASRMYEALRDIVGMCHGGDERLQRIAQIAEGVIKLHEDDAKVVVPFRT